MKTVHYLLTEKQAILIAIALDKYYYETLDYSIDCREDKKLIKMLQDLIIMFPMK